MKTTSSHSRPMCAASLSAAMLSLALVGVSFAQEAKPTDKYVTREEYEKVLKELADIKAQLERSAATPVQTPAPPAEGDALKARVQTLEKKQEAQQAENEQSLDELEKRLKDVWREAKPGIPGSNRMLLTGYGAGTFQATRDGYGPAQSPGNTPAPGEPRP